MNSAKNSLFIIVAGCALLAGSVAAQDPAAQSESVQARWQPQELHFQFMGIRTYYSCTSLEDRLEYLLRELGASPDVRVSATGCSPGQISSMITARIRLSMPVDAAGSAATADNAGFQAQRRTVTLAIHGDGRPFGNGDCELLEQVRDQLLPALKLQVVKDDLRCFPGAESLGNKTMQVEALVPVQADSAR